MPILFAFLIPILGVLAVVLLRSRPAALYTLAFPMVMAFGQMHVTWSALSAPLMAAIGNGMSASG